MSVQKTQSCYHVPAEESPCPKCIGTEDSKLKGPVIIWTAEDMGYDGWFISAKDNNGKAIYPPPHKDIKFIYLADYGELRSALNKIGLLASSDKAYTSDFTTEVMGIVRVVMREG